MRTLGRMLFGAALLGVAAAAVASLPDVARYLRIREL